MISDLAAQLLTRMPLFIPPPDSRSEDEIEADIADEIAFHLEQSEREFREAGETDDAAIALAKERFGNIDEYKREMKSIALRERIMLQRINFVLMVIVLLVVGPMSLQVFLTQRQNATALQTITSELKEMKSTAQAESATGHVILDGDVEHPGWHEFSIRENEHLADVLRRANVDAEATIWYDDPSSGKLQPIPKSLSQTRLLRNGDRYLIQGPDSRSIFAGHPPDPGLTLPGMWRQVDTEGNFVPNGISFEVEDPNDFMSETMSVRAVMTDSDLLEAASKYAGDDPNQSRTAVILYFDRQTPSSNNLQISLEGERNGKPMGSMGIRGGGRWMLKEDRLYLNLGLLLPDQDEPLIFERVR